MVIKVMPCPLSSLTLRYFDWAAAQRAGFGGVGRVTGALVFVKRNEHMNGIAGIWTEIGRLDNIIGPVFPTDQTWQIP